ncbi:MULTISPECIES: alkene reductase [Chitinophagaceae]
MKLLEPVKIGGLQLRNRIVMAAMTRSRAIGNVPNLLMAEYYQQRSSAGLIVTEGAAPSPDGLGYCRIPGIFSEEQIEGWKAITKAVHKVDGAIFLQILHTGRIAAKQNLPNGAEIVAPSAIAAAGEIWTDTDQMVSLPVPREMTLTDIAAAIAGYKQAAINAMAAGFDGVELHAATGYLPNQFLSNHANQRSDEYGGSMENRSRFVTEVLKAMSDAIGSHKVGIKFSPGMTFNDCEIDDAAKLFPYLLKQINALGLAYVCVMRLPGYNGFDVLKVFRETYTGTLMVNLGYDKNSGEQALRSGQADLVAYGSLFISNPDLPARFALDTPLAIPDQNTYYSSGAAGFTDYPVLGE